MLVEDAGEVNDLCFPPAASRVVSGEIERGPLLRRLE